MKEKIKEVIKGIKQKMSNLPGIENLRILISAHLTKILMLYGRLHTDYNARYLPVTINSLLLLINELEMIEKQNEGFSEILKENIDRRTNYSNVFLIPEALKDNATANGLRLGMCELAAPIIKGYCIEDRNFLINLDKQVSEKTRTTLFLRTQKNCELLVFCCPPEDLPALEALRDWCASELDKKNKT